MLAQLRLLLSLLLFIVSSSTLADGSDEAIMLIAHPDIKDGFFRQSVLVVKTHGKQGSVGIVVNKPSDYRLESLFPNNDAYKGEDKLLFRGGPIAPKMFVYLYNNDSKQRGDALGVSKYFSLTFKAESIREILTNKQQLDKFRVYNGHSGWGAGQLKKEIERGDWLVLPFDERYLMSDQPERLWSRLVKRFSGEWI
jgi:putative transcriptional regulator